MPEGGARQARSARTREQLLDAVAQDVARHGFAGTNVEHVADRLSLTKGAFYGHFPSKAAVAEELCRRFESALAEACARAADRPGPPARQLRRLADAVAAAIASSVQVEAGLRITLDQARAERGQAPVLVELREQFAAAFRAAADPDPAADPDQGPQFPGRLGQLGHPGTPALDQDPDIPGKPGRPVVPETDQNPDTPGEPDRSAAPDPDQAASLVLLSVLFGAEAVAWGGEADRIRLAALLESLCDPPGPTGDGR